jgi:hypothetical protein
MKRNTLIEHKEVAIVCEESGFVCLNYNVLLTTLKVNVVVKHVVTIVTVKSTLTYTNCGETGHSVETCHNMKREILVVLIVKIKFTKPIVGTKTQPVKSRKILARYPYIICSNIEHRSEECPRKIEIQNMFIIKLVSSNATTTHKSSKIDNLLVDVVAIITTHSQQSKQHVFKERELVKIKGAKEWQQEECLRDFFIEIVGQLQQWGCKTTCYYQ